MEYRCISADCHIDLCWLPHDLFVSNASKAMKDRMPYVTQELDSLRWVTKSGLDLGLANGNGSPGAYGGGRKYIPGHEPTLDRIASTGLFSDGSRGIFRPTTPELRLQDQDRDGLQAEVLYGLHNTGRLMTDREAAGELFRIYNDWLCNFCNYNPERFVGLGSISSHDVEEAVAETYRIAKLGLGGLDFLAAYDMVPLWHPYWEPFWKAATEVNLAVHIHEIGPAKFAPAPEEDLPETVKLAKRAKELSETPLKVVSILTSVMYSGALERYPSLRIVLGESGIGWIPYILQRMDAVYENRFKDKISLKMKPSDYWLRQCRATFEDDVAGTMLLDILGVENVMWATDYPHPASYFPDSQESIKRQFSHLPSAARHKVICENAGKFYGLM